MLHISTRINSAFNALSQASRSRLITNSYYGLEASRAPGPSNRELLVPGALAEVKAVYTPDPPLHGTYQCTEDPMLNSRQNARRRAAETLGKAKIQVHR